MIQIKMFKANEGDAFLVSFGINKDTNIMIDMGLDTTYHDYIKPELQDLKNHRKKLDLLVISHIDQDHILGALEFIKENGKNRKIIDVEEVWHNTYRHLQFDKKKVDNLPNKEREKVDELISSNKPKSYIKDGDEDISVPQGISFGSYILKYKYNWNDCFKGNVIKVNKDKKNDKKYIELNKKYIGLNKEIEIIILSPDDEKLDKLSKKWIEDLKDMFNIKDISKEDFWDDAFEYYMQYLKDIDSEDSDISYSKITKEKLELWASKKEKDYSKTNGSSISMIIEYGKKKLLFLGDSHEDIIYKNLLDLKNEGYELNFEVVKVSHHGSNKNISKRLIDLIDAKKFLISTNGKQHKHPDLEAIAKIITKKTKYKKELIFNYRIDKLEALINEELENTYNYNITFLDEEDTINIE